MSVELEIRSVEKAFKEQAVALGKNASPRDVEAFRVEYLGRKGKITGLMSLLKTASDKEKPLVGKMVNDLRAMAEREFSRLKIYAADQLIHEQVTGRKLDVSLPTPPDSGALHPVSLMRKELTEIFHRMGFSVYEGPEIDLDFYNFSALNFPSHHPARDMQDTFFIDDTEPMVLRTHTSNIQIHAMLNEKPPLRVVAMGRTFRCDSDLTHTPMFHQIEGFVVDKNITIAHLAGVIDAFVKDIFGSEIRTRLRPSYFPFVEPGAEMDMQCVACSAKGCRICSQTGWLEIGGCGMIHPNVFEAVNYDSEEYTGFAFGFGIDRMAMLKYRLPDLRQLFDGSKRFLNQFSIFS